MSKLPGEFKTNYMQRFITECTTAYGDVDESYKEENISCVPGILERLIMSLGYTASVICSDTEKCSGDYKEIMEAFEKPVLKIDIKKFFEAWYLTFNDSDNSISNLADPMDAFETYVMNKNYQPFSKDDVKKAFSEFITSIPKRDSDYYNSILEPTSKGGRRKRTLKKRKTKSKTKKRGKPMIRKRVNKTKRRQNTKKRK